MADEIERTATCACGGLSIRCRGEPLKMSLCHCLECQKRTGSAFGVAVFFDTDAVAATGERREYSRVGDSGQAVVHYFCPNCGSTVFWEPAFRPGRVAVALGAFADPDFPAPTQAVYEHHRHAWVRFS